MGGTPAANAGGCRDASQTLASAWQPVLARVQQGLAQGFALTGARSEAAQMAWRWGRVARGTLMPGPELVGWPGWGLLLHAGLWAALHAAEGRLVPRRRRGVLPRPV